MHTTRRVAVTPTRSLPFAPWRWAWLLMLLALCVPAQAQTPGQASVPGSLTLGTGDLIGIEVFNRPELSTETYVADDGTVSVPLAGKVPVAGLSPAAAADRIEAAFVSGEYLINPQVAVKFTEFRSQQISVLGEVGNPGRFPVESRTTLFDALALAGGITEMGSYVVNIVRNAPDGALQRYNVDLNALGTAELSPQSFLLQGGDSIFVARAERFYIMGEVNTPDAYRLEPHMTVMQAISLGGGVTERGSSSRVEIKRRQADGSIKVLDAELDDPVLPDDVIRVKERIF